MKQYYAAITTGNGERKQGIYSPGEYFAETFSPNSIIHYVTDLKPHNKQEARQMAIDILDADRETVNTGGECLSYGEYIIIESALERAAQRYGLIREFRENGIL